MDGVVSTYTCEEHILRLCAAQAASHELGVVLVEALRGFLHWNRLLSLADRNDLVPLLYTQLAAVPELVPQAVLAYLEARSATVASWNLALASELLKLVELLQQNGIRAVTFKGPALAVALYSQLGVRQCRDLDFFIDRQDLWQAVEILESAGYRLMHPETGQSRQQILESWKDVGLENAATGVYVELHWAVCEPQFDDKLHSAVLWRETQRVRLLGTDLCMPRPEELLFLLSVHGSRHYWNSFKWICDIGRLLQTYPDFDWQRALHLADSFGRRRTLLMSVNFAHDLLEAPLPPEVNRLVGRTFGRWSPAQGLTYTVFADEDDLFPEPDKSLFSSRRAAQMDLAKKIFRLRSKDRVSDRLRCSLRLLTDFSKPHPEDRASQSGRSRTPQLLRITQPVKLFRAYGVGFFLRTSKDLLVAVIR